MIVKSKYTKIFKSNDLTRQKYDESHSLAVVIRDQKNKVSDLVNKNLRKYLEYTKYQFIKEMRELYNCEIPSSFDAQAYTHVYTCYENKFDAIKRQIEFRVSKFKGFELYKRDTKKNKKGDLKSVEYDRKKTPLSNCLTYLARYGNEQTITYINSQLPTCDEKKRKFYENILRCCDKFGFERLLSIALQRRNRIFDKHSKYPIEFKSLTFGGRSRKNKIVDYNSNFNSLINSFISLSGFGRKSFDIPVKYNKTYHGHMKKFLKKSNDYEYLISFDEINHQVNIFICIDDDRYIPEAGNSIEGIDVNIKRNLFTVSDSSTYDYNRKLVEDYCRILAEIDKLKEDKNYEVGKKKQRKLDKMKEKMIKSEQQTIAEACQRLKVRGVNHIVMEDLDGNFGKCYVDSDDFEEINFNRIVKFVGLSNIKNEFIHIARKYDIAVSIVHKSYTSQTCPHCGHVDEENRTTQEHFKCVHCGYEADADLNAAVNIKNRVLVTVLRDSLLKRLDNNAYEPIALDYHKVKDVLLSLRYNQQLTVVDSKCGQNSMNTFDYV